MQRQQSQGCRESWQAVSSFPQKNLEREFQYTTENGPVIYTFENPGR